jgi:ATP-dependent Clp protease ATP-binding subunit ClpA
VVSFKNALVVLTSNIGSRVISARQGGLNGFAMREQVRAAAWPAGREHGACGGAS